MKLIITGAGGFLGQELIRQLALEEDYYIYALTSQTEKLKEKYADNSRVQVCHKDILLKEDISLANTDVLINCAFPRNSSGEQFEDGLEYIKNILLSAVKFGVGAVINISSQSLYNQHRQSPANEVDSVCLDSMYALGKYTIEMLVKVICSDIVYTNIRMASLIGPGFDQRVTNKFVNKAFQAEELSVKNGNQYFGFLDVEDAARGILKLMQTPFEKWKNIYNLGSQKGYTLLDIAKVVAEVMEKHYGKKVMIEIIEDNFQVNSTIDSALLMKDTGYHPQISLEDSILRIAQSVREKSF